MEYRFSNDFLIYPGETNFDDVWEMFCCKLLNIDKRKNNIYRRTPPENGVDLFSPDDKIAYQCKSTENADSKGHNLTKIEQSYQSALKIKNELDWEKYYICLNYDLTGNQESNLKEKLPNVEILGKSYWLNLCHKYTLLISENFRQFIPIPLDILTQSIDEIFYEDYAENLKNKLEKNKYSISVYSNRSKSIYKLFVSDEFTVEDLIHILSKAWGLPEPKRISGYDFGLSRAIVFNNSKHSLDKTMKDLKIVEDSIVALWTTISYGESNSGKGGGFMEFYVPKNPQNGLKEYEELIKNAFEMFDSKINK